MTDIVVDASAVLAVLQDEVGAARAASHLATGLLSTVNVIEIVSRLIDAGAPPGVARRVVGGLQLGIVPLDAAMALEAGVLRATTRARGLSLGDRACIATARVLGLPVLTADRAWAELDLGVEVVLIRGL